MAQKPTLRALISSWPEVKQNHQDTGKLWTWHKELLFVTANSISSWQILQTVLQGTVGFSKLVRRELVRNGWTAQVQGGEWWGLLCRVKSAFEKRQACFCSEEAWESRGGSFPSQKYSSLDGWIKHPGINKVVLASGLTALLSNNLFSSTRNGQVSRNNFLQHSVFNFFIFWPRKSHLDLC